MIWIVEEIDHKTGKTLYTKSFENYQEANEVFNTRKSKNKFNFITLFKEIKAMHI